MEMPRTVSNNLDQDGLGFVPKRIKGGLITTHRELEWLLELPLEVQRQADWNLVACESVRHKVISFE
jgi:hypothetical protein